MHLQRILICNQFDYSRLALKNLMKVRGRAVQPLMNQFPSLLSFTVINVVEQSTRSAISVFFGKL